MTVVNQPGDQVDEKIDRAAMARMLNLADVLELIIDRFDDGSFAARAALCQPWAQSQPSQGYGR